MEYVIPLRESFSLPFLWLQIAGISMYFKPTTHGSREVILSNSNVSNKDVFELVSCGL